MNAWDRGTGGAGHGWKVVVALVGLALAGSTMPAGEPAALTAGPEPSGGWWEQTRRELAGDEYRLSRGDPTGDEWRAPNRAQRFRLSLVGNRLEIRPRVPGRAADEQNGTPAWTMQLVSLLRGRQRRDLSAADIRADSNRLVADHGDLRETFLNDPEGVAHRIVLSRREEGADALELVLQTSGVTASIDGRVVRLHSPGGDLIGRMDLREVAGADGRPLPAVIRPGSVAGELHVVIDDTQAVYPLSATWISSGGVWTAEGNQDAAEFGFCVAPAGDVNGDGHMDILVGARSYDAGQMNEGKAWLYLGQVAGVSALPAWSVEGNQGGARLGAAVSGAGDVNGDGFSDVIVGAEEFDGSGRAWVYLGGPAGLAAGAVWTASGAQPGARFGVSVASAGDVNGDGYSDILIGADGHDSTLADRGQVVLHLGSASGPAASAAWTALGPTAGERFGASVAGAGDANGDGFSDVVVGSPGKNGTHAGGGGVSVFLGQPTGLAATPVMQAEGGSPLAALGTSVAFAGDVNGDGHADVLAGAPGHDAGGGAAGLTLLFLGAGAGPSSVPGWSFSGAVGSDSGWAVSGAGDVNADGHADILVGEPGHGNGEAEEGRILLFLGSDTGPAAMPAWQKESDQPGARLGMAVRSAGDTDGDGYGDILASATAFDNGQPDEGSAFVYYGSVAALEATPDWAGQNDRPVSRYGFSVSSAGDVNGDGYGDVLVGAPVVDDGVVLEGKVYLYHGGPAGLSTTPAWSATGGSPLAQMGFSVSSACDVNADGYDDVIIGAYAFTAPQNREGAAFLYLGSAAGLSPTHAWMTESNNKDAQLGSSVACAGDVNGDGFADVILGADLYTRFENGQGGAFLYYGSPAGLQEKIGWRAEGEEAHAGFGQSVASAGDVNGDGYSDIVVGAYLQSSPTTGGRAYVYLGSQTGPSLTPDWVRDGTQAFGRFGKSVASAGDVNGDGYSDLLVGANRKDDVFATEGEVTLYLGSPSGLSAGESWSVTGGQSAARLGESVASAGDINGDGYSDVILGALGYQNGEFGEGGAFVFLGSATGLGAVPDWIGESNQVSSQYGRFVDGAGDVNGDGYSDILVGAPFYENGQQDEGHAFVYLGNAGGLPVLPRVRRGDGTAPLARLPEIDAAEGVRLRLTARSPEGRTRARLEWEVKPFGVPFDGTGTGIGASWVDTGLNGVLIEEWIGGLQPAESYHWRARLLFDPVTSPLVPRGRWLTVPWNGWEERDLGTRNPDALAAVPGGSGVPGQGLAVSRLPDGRLQLDWQPTCSAAVSDYEIYEGTLGDPTSHAPRFCSTGGGTTQLLTPAAGNTYYLVVPHDGVREGSYGRASGGAERPQGVSACRPLEIGTCP